MPKEEFVELTSVVDTDGVLQAVVTFRTRINGERLYSWSFMRSFDQDGIGRRTCWLNTRHAPAVLRLVPRVLEVIEKAEAEYKRQRTS